MRMHFIFVLIQLMFVMAFSLKDSIAPFCMDPTMCSLSEEGAVDTLDPMGVRYSVRSFAPLLSADLIESATDYHLHCDLPGVHPENLDITIGERSILIQAERLEVHKEEHDVVRRVERRYGKVRRELFLPKNCKIAEASAKFVHGVLTISIPKTEDSLPFPRKLNITK